MKFNPFAPNSPAPEGMFVGRLREVERIEYVLSQTKGGNPGAFLITGERGIGKSSLLLYAQLLALAGSVEGAALRFIVIYTDVDPGTTQLGLLKKIELGLRRSLDKNDKARGALRRGWEFLQRVEAAGVAVRERDTGNPLETILEEAAHSLADTINSVTSDRLASDFGLTSVYSGVLLLIDEADNASSDLQLGSFLKLLIERVQRAGCNRLCVGLAGLPKLVDLLRRSHESSLRLFEELTLGSLTASETQRVVEMGLDKAAEHNERRTTIEPNALQVLTHLSEGFPHFIQQFAYSAFAMDDDWTISVDDVMDSAFGSGGAYELIGNRYYRGAFYNQIRQESYREVLRIMAGQPAEWVSKSTIRERFKGKTTTLNNAITALTRLGLIVRQTGTVGSYRLVHRGFARWIKFFTLSPETAKQLALEESGTEGTSE